MGRDLLSLNLVDRAEPRSDVTDGAPTRWSQWEAYRRAAGPDDGDLFARSYSPRRPGRFLWLGVSLALQGALLGVWILRSVTDDVRPPPPRKVQAFLSRPAELPAPPPPPPAARAADAPPAAADGLPRTPSIPRATFEPSIVAVDVGELAPGVTNGAGTSGGVPGGVVGGLVGGLGEPPPPQRPREPTNRPLRIGGPLKPPTKIVHVDPIYPDLASYARVEGLVVLEATIDGDGHVRNVRILHSIPLLDEAAMEAVRQWKYEPTVVDGTPVPVLMTVTVTFALA